MNKLGLTAGAFIAGLATAAVAQVMAAPGDHLMRITIEQRAASAEEAKAASTLAAALFGSPELAESIYIRQAQGGWLIQGSGASVIQAGKEPNGAYEVLGTVGADGAVALPGRPALPPSLEAAGGK